MIAEQAQPAVANKSAAIVTVEATVIERALRTVIGRCVMICRNLNTDTHGFERGPDCARQIDLEANSLVTEALSTVWLSTEEGKQTLMNAFAASETSIATLNKERRIEPALLHQPFGMEYRPTIDEDMATVEASLARLNKGTKVDVDPSVLQRLSGIHEPALAEAIEAEIAICRSTDAAFDRHIDEIARSKQYGYGEFLKMAKNRIPRMRAKCFSSIYFWLAILLAAGVSYFS